MFNVFIPIANCQTVSESVLNSIHQSDVVKNVFIHPTKAFTKGHGKHKNIADNLKQIFSLASGFENDEFFGLCNRDTVLRGHEFGMMYDHISHTPGQGMVGYHPHYSPPQNVKHFSHVKIGLCVIRTKAIKGFRFEMYERVLESNIICVCQAFVSELQEKGWSCGYVGESISNPKEKKSILNSVPTIKYTE